MRGMAGTAEILEQLKDAEMTPGICYVCPFNCPTEVYTRAGQIVYIKGNDTSPNQGSRCIKGQASHYLPADPERLKYPMRRVAPGQFERISWDAAFDLIAEKLTAIKAKWGPESVVFLWHIDPNSVFAHIFLTQCYGTPNYYGHTSACEQDRRLACLAVFGHPFPVRDYERCRHIMLWGINQLGANQNIFESIGLNAALSQGAKLVYVDPAFTTTASKAHEWISIQPGTDGAMALAMVRVIVEEGLYDEPFVRQWCHGFEELRAHLRERAYTPEWAEPICKVPATTIRRLAREFATTRPAIAETFKGLGNYANGLDASRTVYILNALTGNVDGPGNLILKEWAPLNPPIEIPPERRATIARPPLHVAMGYPLAPDLPTQLLPQAVLEGKPYPVKGIFFQCTNPAMSEPNTTRYREMLRALEFSVAIDVYMSETANDCHLALPEASFYERAEVRQGLWMGPQAILCAPAVAPVGEAKPLYEIIRGIAERMGYGEEFRWTSWEDWARRIVGGLPVGLEELKRQGYWAGPLRYHKYQEAPLGTPTGKIELYATSFAEKGYNPLPEWREPKVQPDTEYPFRLINTKLDIHCNLTTQNNPILMGLVGENWAEMNPRDAAPLGIRDGDRIEIESPLGGTTIRVKLREGMRPGVVCVRHGHGFGHWMGKVPKGKGTHINPLIDTNVNPISGGIGYNECKVRVRRV